MTKRCCPEESLAPPAEAPPEDADRVEEAAYERAAALVGHDALIAQAEGELAAVLRRVSGAARR